jgi:MoxR-like ATPase
MITLGKIPDAHIAFLDEIFKSNDGVLNSLLMVLNERRYTNEGEIVPIPVISFFSASNEIPAFTNQEDKILLPLYDRFELKLVTKYIQSRENRLRMLLRKQNGLAGQIAATITLDELYSMQREVAAVTIPETINEIMDEILCELRGLGVHVSDRKFLNYSPIVRAKAWLSARDTVEDTDLSVMKYYLWTTPDEIPVIQKVLNKYCLTPFQEELKKITSMAEESYAEFTANVNNNAMVKLRGELGRIYRMIMKLKTNTSDTESGTAITKAIDDLEYMSKKAHEKAGLKYVPLKLL